MATVVLTAVGTAIGGPIGGAIGSLIGQALDNAVLFRPKGREGARLSDLRVQTSSYGSAIPALFGTMRVAGTVIWATDLAEHREKQGGGKGRPSVTTYAYSASFAVALSSRRVRAVRRIWADGNLLRGAAGDFKAGLGAFRLHDGGEDQMPDSLIAAAVGPGQASAHRGIAYAVFEDLDLSDYGNRIPSLTFEVEADEEGVDLNRLSDWASGGALAAVAGVEGLPVLTGYAADGRDAAEALGPLVEPLGLRLRDFGGVSGLDAGRPSALALDLADPLALANGRAVERMGRERAPAASAPAALSLRHHEPARDYQAGVQRAERPGLGEGEAGVDLPAAMDADVARMLAERMIDARWRGREVVTLRCGWAALTLVPGILLTLNGQAGRWLLVEREWEGMSVRLTLRRMGAVALAAEGAAGGAVSPPDLMHGATRLMLVDLPGLGEDAAREPLIGVAASGAEPGWRSAALFLRDGISGALTSMGRTAAPAVMGRCTGVLMDGPRERLDLRAALEVELGHGAMTLYDADDGALDRGSNLALVGGELIQFGRATPLGGVRWRLSHLLRGRRGTESAMAGHGPDEPFLLIEAETMSLVSASLLPASGTLSVAAIGREDAVPVDATIDLKRVAQRPLSPVHGFARQEPGGVRIGWVRRSRAGWRWRDGVDAPLGEEAERYRLRLLNSAGAVVRMVEVDAPGLLYDVEAMAGDGGAAMVADVVQLGDGGEGAALRIALPA